MFLLGRLISDSNWILNESDCFPGRFNMRRSITMFQSTLLGMVTRSCVTMKSSSSESNFCSHRQSQIVRSATRRGLFPPSKRYDFTLEAHSF